MEEFYKKWLVEESFDPIRYHEFELFHKDDDWYYVGFNEKSEYQNLNIHPIPAFHYVMVEPSEYLRAERKMKLKRIRKCG